MKSALVITLCLSMLLSVGCDEETTSYSTFDLTSLAFGEGEVIPKLHTCHGAGKSPPLSVSRVPDTAKGIVIVLEDVDYITGPYTQWMLWGLPAKVIIPEDIKTNLTELPDGAAMGTPDDGGEVRYLAPCPVGEYHDFTFRAYATDKRILLEEGANRDQLDSAMADHILAVAELTGRVPPKEE